MAATNANKQWFLVGAFSLALGVFLLVLFWKQNRQHDADTRRSTEAPALDVDSTNLLRTRDGWHKQHCCRGKNSSEPSDSGMHSP